MQQRVLASKHVTSNVAPRAMTSICISRAPAGLYNVRGATVRSSHLLLQHHHPRGRNLAAATASAGEHHAESSYLLPPPTVRALVFDHSILWSDTLTEPAWVDNVIPWSKPWGVPRAMAPEGAPPIIILPGMLTFGHQSSPVTGIPIRRPIGTAWLFRHPF